MIAARRLLIFAGIVGTAVLLDAQHEPRATAVPRGPSATLVNAPAISLSGRVDSNSPATWDSFAGRSLLRVFTSFDGQPSVAQGLDVQRLGAPKAVLLSGFDGGGYWLEAVVPDVDGTLYGFYHNERPTTMCPASTKVVPRIGAARSMDLGQSWENLGVLIEAPPNTFSCTTMNQFFVGGVGDLSVMVDAESRDLYIFYSEYLRSVSAQGVAVARLLWADRDRPTGRVMMWREGVWQPARRFWQKLEDGTVEARFWYPSATPLFATQDAWHDTDSTTDAYWGPSVHWNTHLQKYVMLLNRAKNERFDQEGIYVSFAASLDDPSDWSQPVKILSGGSWYPQVIGLEPGIGTDKIAGDRARFFMTGRSEHVIQFNRGS